MLAVASLQLRCSSAACRAAALAADPAMCVWSAAVWSPERSAPQCARLPSWPPALRQAGEPAGERCYTTSLLASSMAWQHPGTTVSPGLVAALRGLQPTDSVRAAALTAITSWADSDLGKPARARQSVWVCLNPSPEDMKQMEKTDPEGLQRILQCQAKERQLHDAGLAAGHAEFTGDAMRAYKLAVAAVAAQRPQYAAKAAELLRAWADTCKEFGTGEANGPLEAGWGGCSMAMAAELLKHSWSGWGASGTEPKFRRFFEQLLMPMLTYHADPQTGLIRTPWVAQGNWGTTITCARLQYAIFTEDEATFNVCKQQTQKLFQTLFVNVPDSNGKPVNDGRNRETLRDIVHAQFELAGMTALFETLLHQGHNLYDDRLRKSYEFHASIILSDSNEAAPASISNELPDRTDGWTTPKPIIANWEIAYAHFVARNGVQMPQAWRILNGQYSGPANDAFKRPEDFDMHWGLGTLTHYSAPPPKPS